MSVKSRLPQIAAALEPRVVQTIRDEVEGLVVPRAKKRAPVDDGDLRDAIHAENTEYGATVIAGNHDVFYGHMVELGTVRTAPHPFLIPALEESAHEIVASTRRAMRGL